MNGRRSPLLKRRPLNVHVKHGTCARIDKAQKGDSIIAVDANEAW